MRKLGIILSAESCKTLSVIKGLSPVLLHPPPYHQSILNLIKCEYDLVSRLLKTFQQLPVRTETKPFRSEQEALCCGTHRSTSKTQTQEKQSGWHSIATRELSRRRFFSLCSLLLKLVAVIDTISHKSNVTKNAYLIIRNIPFQGPLDWAHSLFREFVSFLMERVT